MATFTNDSKTAFLLKEDLGILLKEDGYGILLESNTTAHSDIFTKDSKNSASFTNGSRTSASWSNQSKS